MDHPFVPSCAVILPLGAIGDLLEALLPILFVLFWVVSQVINVVQRVRGAGDAARRGKGGAGGERVVRPVAPPRDAGTEARQDLERQIEAFRRGQAEAAKPAGRAAPVPAATGPAPPRPASAPPARAAKPPRREQAPSRPRPAPPPSPALGGHDGDIARHVEGAFAHDLSHARAARPAAAVAGAMPVSVPEAAGGVPAAGPAPPRSTAAELVAMIRNPATVRQAILLGEVLGRPVDRW